MNIKELRTLVKQDFPKMKLPELKEICRKNNISKFSSKNKQPLITFIISTLNERILGLKNDFKMELFRLILELNYINPQFIERIKNYDLSEENKITLIKDYYFKTFRNKILKQMKKVYFKKEILNKILRNTRYNATKTCFYDPHKKITYKQLKEKIMELNIEYDRLLHIQYDEAINSFKKERNQLLT
jgi:hypothetical protein